MQSDCESAPIVMGGLGGSGTRVLAEIVQGMGVHIGECLNHALDNRWFAMLFRRTDWSRYIPEGPVDAALDLFARASLTGLGRQISAKDRAYVEDCLSLWRLNDTDPVLARDIVSRLYNSTGLQAQDGAAWGWKEPNSHIFIPHIARTFPKAKYILMVRHGLDMAYSNNRLQVRQWGAHLGIETTPGRSVSAEKALDYWIAANDRARENLRTHFPNRWLEIRFETLLQDPMREVARLAEFLDRDLLSSELAELAALLSTPSSLGRFRGRSLKAFRSDQIETLAHMGFAIS